MVVTRRGAAAAAAASVAEVENNSPVSEEASSEDDLIVEKERAAKSSISWRLGCGHLCAMVALLTTIDAAMRASTSALPIHAVVLLFCSVPLRTILAFTAHSVQEPAVQSGMVLALSAPVLFASNAMHVLATQSAPAWLLQLIGCAAVDVCANWLKMVASAKTPHTDPFAIPLSLVYSAADVFLAALIAKQEAFVALFYPFLGIRLAVNARLLVISAISIVTGDELKKTEILHEPR